MRPILFLLLLFTSVFCPAQDSTRRVQIYSHTLDIPSSWQYILDTDSSGYITNSVDTLFFDENCKVRPVMREMIYYTGEASDPRADSINAVVKLRNDTLRMEDPRVGTYYDLVEHGDHCWYERIYPMKGYAGTISLEVTPDNGGGFLLWTTHMEWSETGEWKKVLESLE